VSASKTGAVIYHSYVAQETLPEGINSGARLMQSTAYQNAKEQALKAVFDVSDVEIESFLVKPVTNTKLKFILLSKVKQKRPPMSEMSVTTNFVINLPEAEVSRVEALVADSKISTTSAEMLQRTNEALDVGGLFDGDSVFTSGVPHLSNLDLGPKTEMTISHLSTTSTTTTPAFGPTTATTSTTISATSSSTSVTSTTTEAAASWWPITSTATSSTPPTSTTSSTTKPAAAITKPESGDKMGSRKVCGTDCRSGLFCNFDDESPFCESCPEDASECADMNLPPQGVESCERKCESETQGKTEDLGEPKTKGKSTEDLGEPKTKAKSPGRESEDSEKETDEPSSKSHGEEKEPDSDSETDADSSSTTSGEDHCYMQTTKNDCLGKTVCGWMETGPGVCTNWSIGVNRGDTCGEWKAAMKSDGIDARCPS